MSTVTHHLYRGFALKSVFCKECGYSCFTDGDLRGCCHRPIGKPDNDIIQVEISGKARRKRPKTDEAKRILEYQNHKCLYCGIPFDSYRTVFGKCEKVRLHWDHRIPFIYAQTNSDFVASCSVCNGIKSARLFETLDEARAFILKRYEGKERISKRKMCGVRWDVPEETRVVSILRFGVSVGGLESRPSTNGNKATYVGEIGASYI